MHPFRRINIAKLKQRTRTTGPTIDAATVVALSSIAALPSPVRASIGPDDLLVCVVAVESPERRYTLVLDLEWVSLAVDVETNFGEVANDLPLPRAAMRAVINDWSFTDAFDDPTVRWSQDRIPHVGFPATHELE